jgi:hypothetical protein
MEGKARDPSRSMTPDERVAFILHDVFGYSFAEVASSARHRIRAAQAPATPAARQAGIVRDFKQAWEARDIDAPIGLLDPGVTVTRRRRRPGQLRAPPDRRRRADHATWPISPAGHLT